MVTFGAPLVLLALLALPAVWWLLRVMPPVPKSVRFPAIELLRGLLPDNNETAHTPPWLLVLRMAVLAFVIMGLSDPVLDAAEPLPPVGGPVLIVVDNGWEAAVNWDIREKTIMRVAGQAARAGRSVILLPTAPPASGGPLRMIGPLRAGEVEEIAGTLRPMPWVKDPGRVAADVLGDSAALKNPYIVWLGDGFAGRGTDDFMQGLSATGKVLYIADDQTNTPLFFDAVNGEEKKLAVRLTAAGLAGSMAVTVLAAAKDGRVLAEVPLTLSPDKATAEAVFDLPPGLAHQITRLFVREKPGAAATWLQEGGQWRPVGILADSAAEKSEGYLSDAFYLNRALEPFADVTTGGLDLVLERERSVIFWPDSYILSSSEREKLRNWVEGGGHLVRFAGQNLGASAGVDEMGLLPVVLRAGGRNLEGTLAWGEPQHIAPIDKASPLFGVDVPTDVTVERQVLAEPSSELETAAIVRLTDGTPLVTTASAGRGRITLVHTTAGPEWSNVSLSGFFVAMLRQFISMGAGLLPSSESPLSELKAQEVMDGFGRLAPPQVSLPPLRGSEFRAVEPSASFPPGFYGDATATRALNLAGHIQSPEKILRIPKTFDTDSYSAGTEKKLKGAFLLSALALFLVDTVASLFLSGALARFFIISLIMVCVAVPARAEDADAVKYSNHIHFAWIKTGDAGQDQISQSGLLSLCGAVSARTSSRCEGVAGVAPGVDELSLFPFVYWPMTASQKPLTNEAARGLRRYLDYGGLLLIDTRDEQYGADAAHHDNGLGESVLRQIMQGVELPPLMPIPADHILSRSFYLLNDYPGRWTGSQIWVEKTVSTAYDNVPTVVIGGNDWASAWAAGEGGAPLYGLPGGERQREMALRFGVNLAMVAMTGSYKADQVHLPHILERIGQ